ncbi:f-box pof7 [Fusarium beomiforme]|uniref:F-box pof7 n=1 Tax=Fusarium beomiforme TaxID=44412 RepID=A0A9P5A5P8_9HYPO|nr:f-box pof7 [Fusarium beomiforme]
MTEFRENVPTFLKVSNEVLLAIFGLCRNRDQKQQTDISNLRLTCRRFCSLCSDYAIRRCATLDFSRPESVKLFRQVLHNPQIAEHVHELNVRLHFYHSWIAASLENFITAICSEWEQRTQATYQSIGNTSGRQVTFEYLIQRFVSGIEMHNDVLNEPSTPCNRHDCEKPTCPKSILHRAYDIYKEKYNAQKLWHGDGAFSLKVAEIIHQLPNIRHVTLHDGVLENNYDMGRKFDPISQQDTSAQADMLIQVLSRPMLWEEARWIQPSVLIWPGVPIRLLVDIPLALGAIDSLIIDQFSIHVSAAPDYMAMQMNKNDRDNLSQAIKHLDLLQFTFLPRCRSGCGPWTANDEDNDTVRTASEMEVLHHYLGTFFNSGCITHADINLGEFWYSLGLKSMLAAPTSVGIAFTWPVESSLSSIHLTEISVTASELGAMAEALRPKSELELFIVHIKTGLWREALQNLRQGLRNPQSVYIRHPSGGEIQSLTDGQIQTVFNVQHTEEGTKAECYVMGTILENPLAAFG